MGRPIDKITLKGFKSIRTLEDFELRPLNVLIGANGSGKSNFVSFFRLLRELVEGRLEFAVNKGGGADAQLFLGPKETKKIVSEIRIGSDGYMFELEPTVDNRLVFAEERILSWDPEDISAIRTSLGSGHSESKLKEQQAKKKWRATARNLYEAISSWTAYHFHDTSETAAIRRTGSVRDHERLRPDGANLAAFLFRLKEEHIPAYEMIRDTIRLTAPFFEDFRFRPNKSNGDEFVALEWTQEDSAYPFHPSQLSDGTLRFSALTTALLQPEPPTTILLDEPELGLHPYALGTLAALIKSASVRCQIVVATQSPTLLDEFEPQDVVLVDRQGHESIFSRPDPEKSQAWLEEYRLGEVWWKNVIGGGPGHA
jgi:predicted ATPase